MDLSNTLNMFKGEFLFLGGDFAGRFLGNVFPKYFFWIGSKVCDVYIQKIRISKADVLNIHITYFWPDLEKIFGKNIPKKRPAKPPPKKRNSHFVHDVTFVIFIFFEECNQKKAIDNRILSKKAHRYFWQFFEKNLRTKNIWKCSICWL